MRPRSTIRVVIAAVLVLVVCLTGPALRSHKAQAEPTNVLGINWVLCFFLTADKDWDDNGFVDNADKTVAFVGCQTLNDQYRLEQLVRVLGGDPQNPSPTDFAAIDVDGNQLHEQDGSLWVIAFVSNDEPVAFSADEGVFQVSGTATAACGPLPSHDFQDEDCDDDGVEGDGVVVTKIAASGGARGPASVVATQSGVDTYLDYTITGEPYEIHVTAAEPTIETGAASCEYPQTEAEWSEALADPQRTVLTAQILDSDGTPLATGLVEWQSYDENKAAPAIVNGWTADLGIAGVVGRNVLCGMDNVGEVTVEASITKFIAAGLNADPYAGSDDDSVQVVVVPRSPANDTPTPTTTPTATATRTPTATPKPPAGVGGAVELPAAAIAAESDVSSEESGGAASGVALAGAVVGGVVVLTAGGWYARRRRRAR